MCVANLIHCLLTLLKNHHVKYSTQLSDNPRVIHMVPLHDSKARVVYAISANSMIELIYFSVTVISERCLGQILEPFLKCKYSRRRNTGTYSKMVLLTILPVRHHFWGLNH